MHEQRGIPSSMINYSTMCKNVRLSYTVAGLMEILGDDDLNIIEGNYRKYKGSRSTQTRAVLHLINDRRRPVGLPPVIIS